MTVTAEQRVTTVASFEGSISGWGVARGLERAEGVLGN
jgi:hypothetical protein